MSTSVLIDNIEARQIADSRGNPTVECTIYADTYSATASVPSGKSSGSREALELRDEDGRGVRTALARIRERIAPAIVGKSFEDSTQIDEVMIGLDGTSNKTELGANAMLAVSCAAAKLFAHARGVPTWRYIADVGGFTPAFPRLYMNMMNGGAHADFCLPFQEYIAVVGNDDMPPSQSYALARDIFERLGRRITEEIGTVGYGDEGGYTPHFQEIERPFELLQEFVRDGEVFIAIDAAASEFYRDGGYEIAGDRYTRDALLGLYHNLSERFALRSIEDGFAEDDIEGFRALMNTLGDRVKVVGDDLTVTNPRILAECIDKNACNALIIKPNQIGTVCEVLETVRLAYDHGLSCIASHRSGETMDDFIADVAVGIGAYGIKAGAHTQAVRRVKYERLAAIEREYERWS